MGRRTRKKHSTVPPRPSDELLDKSHPEVASVVIELFDLVDRQVAIIDGQAAKIKELESEVVRLTRLLNTNSTNSGISPSKDPVGFSRQEKDNITESDKI